MNIEIKEELKEMVLKFIEEQPGYDADYVEEIKISCTDKNRWSIAYGDIQFGIIGVGDSAENAFDDFVVKWRSFKGFEWLKKVKIFSNM